MDQDLELEHPAYKDGVEHGQEHLIDIDQVIAYT